MRTSGETKRAILQALIASYDLDGLKELLSFRLDHSLDEIVLEGGLRERVFELIETADRENWLDDLIRAASAERPEDETLKRLASLVPQSDSNAAAASTQTEESAPPTLPSLHPSENVTRSPGRLILAGVGGVGLLILILILLSLGGYFNPPKPTPPVSTIVISPPVGTLPASASPGPASTSPGSSAALAGRIIFTCHIDLFDDICLMNANGQAETRLTNSGATSFYPDLSPDGQFVVFSSNRSGRYEIYTMKLEGATTRQLTNSLGSLFAPVVSPDGQRIVFHNDLGGSRKTVWIMDRDGKTPRQIIDAPGGAFAPTWAPNSRQIAYIGVNEAGQSGIYIAEPDSSNTRNLLDYAQLGGRLDWSPDGSMIAFFAGPANNRQIFVVTLKNGQVRQLTKDSDNLSPSFSPDGNWLTFTSVRDGNNEIYRLRVDDGKVIRITDNNRTDYQPRWGP
jgi:Tol biopolymer transport system component